MKVKTEQQLVVMALKIAQEDGNATVMVALPNFPAAQQLFAMARIEGKMLDCTIAMKGMQIEFPSGGRVLFRAINEENKNEWGGYMYSHAFAPRGLHYLAEIVVKSKIRCSKKLLEPMGYYTPYFVERWHRYEE